MTVLFLLLMLSAFLTADHFVQRARTRKVGETVRERVASLVESFRQIPADVEVALNHTWTKTTAGPLVTVGLDEFVAKFFGTVERIVVPEAGMAAGSILLQDGERSLSLALPVRGRVAAVNTEVLNNPAATHADPYGKGWLLQIAPEPGAPRRSPAAPHAPQWLRDQVLAAREFFLGRAGAENYAFMQDGGTLVDGILKLYDGAVWNEFGDRFLTPGSDAAPKADGTK